MISWAAVVLLVLELLGGSAARYDEELVLQHLGDGSVLAHFELSSATALDSQHVGTFPSSLLGLLKRHGVHELEVSLTRGRWVWHQQAEAEQAAASAAAGPRPPGLELKLTFDRGVINTQAAYAALTQGLGGLLCAGVATVPRLAVMAAPAVGWFAAQRPPAVAAGGRVPLAGQATQQVYAYLPEESVCLENLAAWRRLLPCRDQAGLAALLQPLQLVAAPYQSLGLHLWVAGDGPPTGDSSSSNSSWQEQVHLRQVLTAVLPTPAGDSSQVQQQEQDQTLLQWLFGSQPPSACSAADSSWMYLAGAGAVLDSQPTGIQAAAASCQRRETAAGPLLACDMLQLQQPAQQLQPPASLLRLLSRDNDSRPSTEHAGLRPALQVVQHTVQRGSRSGRLVVGVRVAVPADGNAGPQLLHIMQLLPWQLQADATSVQASLNGKALQAGSPELVWQLVNAQPDRTAVVELLLRLPSGSSSDDEHHSSSADSSSSLMLWHDVRLSMGYLAAFVSVFDHAPDASRGVDVPPAVATLLPVACASSIGLGSGGRSSGDDGGGSGSLGGAPPLLRRLQATCSARQQYSSSGGGGVVPLPLPDFSMPFNVICFTSTLLAILLGGAANVVLKSPEELAGGGAAAAGGTPVWKRKLRRVAAMLLLMGGLAVYLDRDLQRQADALLQHLPHARTRAPEQHGEL